MRFYERDDFYTIKYNMPNGKNLSRGLLKEAGIAGNEAEFSQLFHASGGEWNGEFARASGEEPIFQQIPQDRRAIAPADFFAFRIVAAVI